VVNQVNLNAINVKLYGIANINAGKIIKISTGDSVEKLEHWARDDLSLKR